MMALGMPAGRTYSLSTYAVSGLKISVICRWPVAELFSGCSKMSLFSPAQPWCAGTNFIPSEGLFCPYTSL